MAHGSRDGRGSGSLLAVAAVVAVWCLTRAVLLLWVFKVSWFPGLPGPDVTSDVSGIYHGWFEVLKTGAFPVDDVTWQYPPLAALAILSPALLPTLSYSSAFFVLASLCDAVVLGMLLRAGTRPGRSLRGAWVWVAGLALLGPTAYARYDVMVPAVAVAALLAGAARPRLLGALAGVGAMLKVWPVLLLLGTPRGMRTRLSWATAAVACGVLALLCIAFGPGAFAFLTFQKDRGTEVESLGSLVFHVARHFGWQGQVLLHYGSVEFLGPYVSDVSRAALGLSALGLAWLVLWRVRAKLFTAATLCDAALAAVLLFTTTSRVISPQYMLWLVGVAAVCAVLRESVMGLPAVLTLAATAATLLEFPIHFGDVVASDTLGLTLLFVRNGLLVAATLTACARLWRSTVAARDGGRPQAQGADPAGAEPASGAKETADAGETAEA
jgi:Glycosyltransferase family 87